jgi:predicted alpha/beta-fold hydrolase
MPFSRFPHLGTVLGTIGRPWPRPAGRRERFELPDGDFLDLTIYGSPGPKTPLAVVLHGLEGSSGAPYVRGLAHELASRGVGAVAVDFRGCSGTPNRLPRFYHSGETGDLDFVVRRLAAERPGRPLALAGFSLGGNVVAKYLGERGDDLPPELLGGAVVSVPFDLAACARTLDSGGFWNFVYRERFLRKLRRKALAKARRFPDAINAAGVARARSFAEYDEVLTSRLHGFAGAEDYWSRSSAGRFLDGVRRPLLAIAAEDDPIVPRASLPVDRLRANRDITFELRPSGGHVAFLEGPFWRFRSSAEGRMAGWIAERVAAPS